MTAHDPRVTLTEAVAHAIANTYGVQHNSGPENWGEDWTPEAEAAIAAMQPYVEQIIAARLDRVRAVAEQWDNGCAREVLAALDAPQDAPRGPVGGEQGAEVAGGRSEGARPGEGDLCDSRGPRIGAEGCPRCRLTKGHGGVHRADPEDGWGEVSWGLLMEDGSYL